MPDVRVAFQGEHGAYSEEAVIEYFGEVDLLPCRTFLDVFRAVAEGGASDGLVPVENSLAGTINETYDLLLQYDIPIYGEVVLQIEHCLMAIPGQDISQIRRVYSHPQALAQCDVFLRELGVETVAIYDTAGGARMVSERRLRGTGAIAAARAANLYGLEVIARGIQNEKDNFTRFYAIGWRKVKPAKRNKSVLVFATEHKPGALYACLGAFASQGLNLLKIESRPRKGFPWEYVFYVDIEASDEEERFQRAISSLRESTTMLRVLGSFPRAEGRN